MKTCTDERARRAGSHILRAIKSLRAVAKVAPPNDAKFFDAMVIAISSHVESMLELGSLASELMQLIAERN